MGCFAGKADLDLGKMARFVLGGTKSSSSRFFVSHCRFHNFKTYLCQMIHASRLHKHYGDLHVLKGVELDIEKGEIVSIVGASGAGKTTLLQILGTLENADAGADLSINGQNISGLKDRALSRFRNANLGFIFQFHQLLPEFTALENVCIPAYIAGKKTSETEADALKLLDYLGLSDRATHKPGALSGGEQQRVAVARALINRPAVVFADEPSGNLDTHSAENLHQLFFRLRDEFGQTFVIVTHNEELAAMADRKLTMVDGQISR
jgi:lipoprotein-releasing system ATP-binding protein